jgi:biopolymer transport protein TolQ
MDFSAIAFAHDAAAAIDTLSHALSHLFDVTNSAQQPAPAPLDAAPSAAPLTPIDVTQTGGEGAASGSSVDMSPLALFMKADIVVKSVMGMLLLASFWSWAIILGKWIRLSTVRGQADKFEQLFWSGRSLDEVYATLQTRQDHHPMAHVFVSAMREWKRSFEMGPVAIGLLPGVKDRITKVMNVTINRELTRLESSLGFLATVGANATFIGVFGTVWGIMNSFRQIALSNDTSLAVVAPGIAEALFATAMGLVAAIPASVAYNNLASSVNRMASRLEGFAEEFSAILSRQLDEKAR